MAMQNVQGRDKEFMRVLLFIASLKFFFQLFKKPDGDNSKLLYNFLIVALGQTK